MTKASIQELTKELKDQSKTLFERIKTMQSGVNDTLQSIKRIENGLLEEAKEREQQAINAALAERMTAYVMPDEPEDDAPQKRAQAAENKPIEEAKPAAKAKEAAAAEAKAEQQPAKPAEQPHARKSEPAVVSAEKPAEEAKPVSQQEKPAEASKPAAQSASTAVSTAAADAQAKADVSASAATAVPAAATVPTAVEKSAVQSGAEAKAEEKPAVEAKPAQAAKPAAEAKPAQELKPGVIYPFTSASGQKPIGTYTPGQRPPQAPASRPPFGTPRPAGQGDRPPYQSDRPPYQGQRPAGQGDRPPFGGPRPAGQGDRPPFGGPRPAGQGDRPPFGAPRAPFAPGQGRAPYAPGQGRPPMQGQGRPPFGADRGGFGDKDRPAAPAHARTAPRPARPTGGPALTPSVGKEKVSNYDPNKSVYTRNYDNEKKAKSKKTVVKEAPPAVLLDDERMGSRKFKPGKNKPHAKIEYTRIDHAVITTEMTTVKDLSELIGKPAGEIIKKLFMLGVMATINQEIDYDTCALLASDFGITLEKKIDKTAEEVMQAAADVVDEDKDLVNRPPVVTIMGHVDHGKTSLLDAIRETNVTQGEAGGITQHIGAYTVEIHDRIITFLDTPGHEAFTSMRARGAQATDIAILVVAADDGIMPQTVEAINHAKAAKVPIIVAINKMDKPSANPERIMQQLTEHELLVEEWGGDVIAVPVSAKTRLNLDKLLEMILLVADVQELRANPSRLAKGIIIEAQLDKGRGPVATVLVQNGTLHVGDTIVAGTAYGRVRAMINDKGERVDEALPSYPVEVLGFNEVPDAGDILNAVDGDKFSRIIAEERKDKIKAAQLQSMARVSLDDLFSQIAEGQIKDLNVIVKADVQGSVEALKQSIEKISNNEVRVHAIHGGVGAITGTDVMLASASNAIIIGFNVRPDATAREASERDKVDIRLYRVIYDAIEDIEKAMKGMLAPQFKEVVLGHAQVRTPFKVTGVGTIAGSYVQDGKIARNAQIRLVRDGIVVHEGKIGSLKRFKDDAKEVAAGYECGIGIENYNDIKEGDILEAFIKEEIER